MNEKDKIALKVLILDKMHALAEYMLNTSECNQAAFNLIILQQEDYLRLLKKVNKELG